MQDQRVRNTFLLLLTAAVLGVLSWYFLDRPAAWYAQGLKTAPIHVWAKKLSLLAHGTFYYLLLGAGFIISWLALTVGERYAAQPWVHVLLRVLISVSVAIVLVEAVKFLFGRCRPVLLFEHGQFGFTWLASKWEYNSFPSGHTTRIFALMTAFALVFRRGAPLFLLLALLVGASRVFALDHYPSDVLAGAVLGMLAAWWTCALWPRPQGAAPPEAGGE